VGVSPTGSESFSGDTAIAADTPKVFASRRAASTSLS